LIKKWSINYQIDHIIPVSKWWLHTSKNIQLLCRYCNNVKSNKIIEDIFFK
jgi:5-methylcytosine-specific restriction endonuclease McrA